MVTVAQLVEPRIVVFGLSRVRVPSVTPIFFFSVIDSEILENS